MDNNTDIEKSADSSLKIWQKRRYQIALLAFFGFCNVYALRVNLSIAIVAMTENKTSTLENGTVTYSQDFDWNSKQQGFILSSFFYGYILTQFPGGWLASKYGGRRLYGIGIAVTSALTMLTPFVVKQNLYLFMFVRFTEGLFEGVTYPCVLQVWSQWAPPLERSRLVSISFSGSFIGIVISMPVSAYLSNAFGWESIFYVFGAIGMIWYILWLFIVPESPFEDPHIKSEELRYLQLTLGKHDIRRNIKHPWTAILKSSAVWAIIIAHFSENWGYYTLLTQLPKFMKDIFHFELENAGISSAVPYLAMGIALPVAGYIADWLISTNTFSTTKVRKLFTCTAFLSQTTFMVITAYLVSPIGSTACITTAVGLGGFAWTGFLVNYLEVAPQYASVILGIGTTFATLPGILSPTLSGYIVVTPSTSEWQIVFFIAAAIYVAGCIFYGIFASSEIQNWALENYSRNHQTHKCENTFIEDL